MATPTLGGKTPYQRWLATIPEGSLAALDLAAVYYGFLDGHCGAAAKSLDLSYRTGFVAGLKYRDEDLQGETNA